MRVVFIGNGADFSPFVLEALIERSLDPASGVELVGVVVPMRFVRRRDARAFAAKRRLGGVAERWSGVLPAAVGDRLRDGGPWQHMQSLAARAGAPIVWPSTPADDVARSFVLGCRADLGVVAGLDHIVREPLLSAFPPLFNVHPSLLPEYRGAAPEFWQLDDDISVGGVTLHRIDAGVDTGPIVVQEAFAVEPWFDATELIARSVAVARSLVGRFLDGYPRNVDDLVAQSGGSSRPPVRTDDLVVPFDRSARAVFNRARASSWERPLVLHVDRTAWEAGNDLAALAAPAATTLMIEVADPVPFDHDRAAPGTVHRTHGGGVVVSCTPGSVLFRRARARR